MPRIRIPWQELALAAVSLALFFGILEGILAVAGVESRRITDDPYVEISSRRPLYVPESDPSGEEYLETASDRRKFFNKQHFPRRKKPGTYRIFCLGGSTTYGRPFSDSTSFAGWLRQLLPHADGSRDWEVINAGGISYASYRVAAVMRELTAYEPDLFVVYTGHNEFLEERSYSAAAQRLPRMLHSTAATLSRTRTWAAASSMLRTSGVVPAAQGDRYRLPQTVTAKLDRAAGLDLYERDDELADQVVEHFKSSLERMVVMAREAGAELVFVTPAANLRSFSPFKSQYSSGLPAVERLRAEQLLHRTRESLDQARWAAALEAIDEALTLDDRLADAHYLRGRALFGLGHTVESKRAFELARDEDVCPLRATSPLQETLQQVARRTDTPLIDYIAVLESRLAEKEGHNILGEESFLDHVHPTIAGHRLLAEALIEEFIRRGIVEPDAAWGEAAIQSVIERVEAEIDPATQARALAQLAWTLDWAGKEEISRRLALQALGYGFEDPTILLIAARHYAFEGKSSVAQDLFVRALRADPLSPTAYYQYGLFLIDARQLEAAAAHFLRARALWPADSRAHLKFGLIMAERQRFDIALAALRKAQSRNSGDRQTEDAIARIEKLLGEGARKIPDLEVQVETYSSGTPRVIAQSTQARAGTPSLHGVWTQWYETGELESYAEFAGGAPVSPVRTWPRNPSEGDAPQPSS